MARFLSESRRDWFSITQYPNGFKSSDRPIGRIQYSFGARYYKVYRDRRGKANLGSLYFVDVETTVVKTHDVQGSA